MKKQLLLGTVALFLGAVTLCAQIPANYQLFGVSTTGVESFSSQMIGSQVVEGKPFSATEERHSLQTLGDGTHIESSETNRLYRDDQGRTRIERNGGNITIFDPVAGFSVELNPAAKTASKAIVVIREGRVVSRSIAYAPATAGGNAVLANQVAKLREELAQMQSQYTENSPRVTQLREQIANLQRELGPTATFSFSNSSATGETTPQLRVSEDLLKKQAEARLSGGATFSNSTPEGPVVVKVGQGDNASVESLAAQMVNGALAQGTRMTETIPVGKIGNDRVISVVNERWFSSDLQMLVKSSSSDPRFGDTTYQLTNIVQASPDPSLFQIPADYTLRK